MKKEKREKIEGELMDKDEKYFKKWQGAIN